VIDTDSGFVRVLANRLASIGWDHHALASAPSPEELRSMRLNALVVDLAVLDRQAWDYLQRVAQTLPGLGVVVCTTRSSVAERVRGLRLGVDDWVTKPCHPEEVLARVEAVVRRQSPAARQGADRVVAGELEVRDERYQAFVGSKSMDLTRREFELLRTLAGAEGQVLPREELYQRVWGYEMARGDRSVDVFVRKVRSKLKRLSPRWKYIHTHFGVGYRFEAESIAEANPERKAELRAINPASAPGRSATRR
jgi:DNA-binding response OmpR family regulator